MRVFLTGATGLLGSHAALLLRARGHDVVALHRPRADIGLLRGAGCTLVPGDVRDRPSDLARGMEGCTHVLHAAALVYAGGRWPAVRDVNVQGTRNVMEGAVLCGVPHAVHISSVAVYGTVAGPVDERAPTDTPLPAGDLYARSKREAETAAGDVAAAGRLRLTILRPAALYGERDRLMAPRLGRMLRGPVTFLLGRGDNTLPAVYAGNAADAAVQALTAGNPAVWNVGMDHPLTQRALFEGLARGMGLRPRLISVPAGVVRMGAAALQRLGVHAPGAEHLPLSRVARLALGENPYRSGRIRRDLGWTPPFELDAALERTGRWLRDHGTGHGART